MTIDARIQPYVNAMQDASGLSEFDAITCVLYALATYINLPQYPILAFIGSKGTGKSAAFTQLKKMCNGAQKVDANTEAGHRNSLRKGIRTAFVDEADHLDASPAIAMLYTRRFSRETGFVEVNEQEKREWKLNRYDIFGATVIAKRSAIADEALRSRSIIIRTAYKLKSYRETPVQDMTDLAGKVAAPVLGRFLPIAQVDRIQQTWGALRELAREFGLNDWLKTADEIQAREMVTFGAGQNYEPSDAILRSLDILSRDVNGNRQDGSIHISAIVEKAKAEFALAQKPNQVREELMGKGFQVGLLHGYPIVKVKKELLDKLMPE